GHVSTAAAWCRWLTRLQSLPSVCESPVSKRSLPQGIGSAPGGTRTPRGLVTLLRGTTVGVRVVAVTVLSLLALSLATPAEAKIDHDAQKTWGANGPVFTVARVGSRIFLGGAFTALVNPANGKTVPR